jgi:type I restriction-modification system DNA methylase subunit
MIDNVSAMKEFGEVFTPPTIINQLIGDIDYSDDSLKICEPAFGDGRILLFIKNRLLEYHTEKHIIENMLYGVEIQEKWYDEALETLNAKKYNHNLICASALDFTSLFNPLSGWVGIMDWVVANPPFNRNILKKNDVSPHFWEPSGYTTKLAYCCFVVMGNYILKPEGKLSYVMPVSYTHNENTQQFREYLRENVQIDSIDVQEPNVFEGIMIRTGIFKATKRPHSEPINLTRHWRGTVYNTTTDYNEYGEIPLFIGDVSKSIYEKVMANKHTLTAYKGWNGVDSYAKFSSSDPNEYEYKYANGVDRKGEITIYSSQYPDKTKAKVNNKKNNVGNYNRFHTKKVMINEVLYGSMETLNHIKYVIVDELGQYGASPRHTVVTFEDESIEQYIKDISSPVAQMMLSVMKDYNHNDSKLFYYLPYGLSNITLTDEESEFIQQFGGTVPVLKLSTKTLQLV